MVDHGQESQHTMVLSLADLSVWCYPCEEYVHNKVNVCHCDMCCVTVTCHYDMCCVTVTCHYDMCCVTVTCHYDMCYVTVIL